MTAAAPGGWPLTHLRAGNEPREPAEPQFKGSDPSVAKPRSSLATSLPAARWWTGIVAVCAVGLLVRVGYVLVMRNPLVVSGDAYQYHYGANLLVHGKGFINAYTFDTTGVRAQTILHPPGYTVALAVASLVGLSSTLEHQLWSCLIGTATVALVGLVGRRLGGPRVGLIAAGIAAVDPNLWIFDGMLAAETLTLALTAGVLLMAYRLWQRPGAASAVAVGVLCALAALTRGEGLAYLPLVALPAVLAARQIHLRQRLALAGLAALACAATIAPYAGFNTARLDHPTLISSFGIAFVAANCNATYYGPGIGYWSAACFPKVGPPPGDASDNNAYYSHAGRVYVADHLVRLPIVVLARIGRAFDLYRPLAQLRLEAFAEGRPLAVTEPGLGLFYLLVASSVAGVVVLRRTHVPVAPLMGLVLTAVITVAITYGIARYRVSAELVPVLAGAVGLDRIGTILGRRWRGAAWGGAACEGDRQLVISDSAALGGWEPGGLVLASGLRT